MLRSRYVTKGYLNITFTTFDKHTNRGTNRLTDKGANRQAEAQAGRQAARQTDRQTDSRIRRKPSKRLIRPTECAVENMQEDRGPAYQKRSSRQIALDQHRQQNLTKAIQETYQTYRMCRRRRARRQRSSVSKTQLPANRVGSARTPGP